MEVINLLFQEGFIGLTEKSRVTELSTRWNVSPHEIVRILRMVPSEVYLRAYSKAYGIPVARVDGLVWSDALAQKLPWEEWCKALAFPAQDETGSFIVAVVDPVQWSPPFTNLSYRVELISEEVWVEKVGEFRSGKFLDDAVYGLWRRNPESSARKTFGTRQLLSFWGLGTLILAGLAMVPHFTLLMLNSIINIFYFLCIGFKTLLVLIGASRKTSKKVSITDISQWNDADLPIYTVLVPVYKEPRVVPHLVRQLSNLDYPLPKLDVKVLLEQDDAETIKAFRDSNPPPNFHALIVPTANPKTKPKACNYGLHFSRGEYLTIYDAEDLPESDQLKKVVTAFSKLPATVCCIQAALNYFNWKENTLTKMFTLEYSNWFDYNLPGMEALKVPIPLGGTSNHFRNNLLRALGGWDPFNVTEDADLGIRATARGYTIATIDSTTYEEANRAYGNWIRQRSRWIKGYMQTFLVNMRHPFKLWRKIGSRGFIGFLLFIGGTPFIFLANPISWSIFVIWFLSRADLSTWFPSWLLFLSFFNLLVGNFLGIYVCILGVFKRKNYQMVGYALLNPFYWILHAIASYKALWQLIVSPSYWEKTDHGLTSMRVAVPQGLAAKRG